MAFGVLRLPDQITLGAALAMDSLGVDGHLDAFRLVRCQQSGGIYVHIGG